ncbi:hypothetical protein ALP19_200275 [Pseudomonas syringae pv. tomato]|nr:hypothetical protein ALP19_200275 [Pseudomonas syringae pv. tomato]
MVTERAQGFGLRFGGLAQGCGAVGRGLEQHGCLAANHFHVGFFGGAGVADLGQLQHFAFGNDAGRLGQDLHDFHRAQFNHHFERARIKEVTHQHAGRVAPQGVGSGAAAAHAGHVDNVVMQQGGGVQEFDGGGQQADVVAFAAQSLATQQHQQRAQALATCRRDVITDLGDQRYTRRQLLFDDKVNGTKVVRHRAVEGLGLHQRHVLRIGCAAC